MQEFFYGWYMKCQSETDTLAVIPAIHRTKHYRTCSIQFITDDSVYTARFPGKTFCLRGKTISMGKNYFSQKGTGLRESELAGLDLNDLHLEDNGPYITVMGKRVYYTQDAESVLVSKDASIGMRN